MDNIDTGHIKIKLEDNEMEKYNEDKEYHKEIMDNSIKNLKQTQNNISHNDVKLEEIDLNKEYENENLVINKLEFEEHVLKNYENSRTIKTEFVQSDITSEASEMKKEIKMEKPDECEQDSYSNPLKSSEELKSDFEYINIKMENVEMEYENDGLEECEMNKIQDTLENISENNIKTESYTFQEAWKETDKNETVLTTFACTICEMTFYNLEDQQHHMHTHLKKKPYSCNFCNKKFSQFRYLSQHMVIHTENKPYACTLCDKKFILSQHLNSHMQAHSQTRTAECTICNKKFNGSGGLNAHMRVHTGKRLYECSVCNRKFTQMVHVTTHMRIHKENKPRLTSTEKVRAYRQRQREKQITANSSVLEVSQDSCENNNSVLSCISPTTSTNSSTKNKKPPMTSAEKVRAYRQRQREKIMAGNTYVLDGSRNNCENSDSGLSMSSMIYKEPPLTPAERMRAYRRRQREKRLMENSSVLEIQRDNYENNKFEPINKKSSTSTDNSTKIKRPRMTSAEKMRAFRQRQREKQIEILIQ